MMPASCAAAGNYITKLTSLSLPDRSRAMSSSRDDSVMQLMSIADIDYAAAQDVLARCGWNVGAAVDVLLGGGGGGLAYLAGFGYVVWPLDPSRRVDFRNA